MDPLWAITAEYWWTAPVALGAGALGAAGMRRRAGVQQRRLAFDAARRDLNRAKQAFEERRRALKVARAEHVRLSAERAAGRARPDEVSRARQILRQAEHDAKAAIADVRVRRARLSAARAEIPHPSDAERMPLARLRAAEEAITTRWMEYETDPAKLIAYPTMSDGRNPATARFLDAAAHARSRRPASYARVTPKDFAEYRDAVADLERAFDAAERAAQGRASGIDASPLAGWQESTQQALNRSAEALDRAAGIAASALAAWNARERRKHPSGAGPERDSGARPPAPGARPPASGSGGPPASGAGHPPWPVPRRDGS